MRSRRALMDLVDLTEALYRSEQTRTRDLQQRETDLRQALKRLETSRKSSLISSSDRLDPLRQIGADVLWQGWLGRNREELNRQLALCLAQKAHHLTELRRVFGRHVAAQSLLDDDSDRLKQDRSRTGSARDETLSLLRAVERESHIS